jgi:signal transduction histidine kinase
MDQKEQNSSSFNERYIITDMIVFTLCSAMIILLVLDCLRIYSESKFNSLNLLKNKIDNIDIQLSSAFDKSILKLQFYEEKIINHIKGGKKSDLKSIKITTEIDDKNFYFIPFEVQDILTPTKTTDENLVIKPDKKDCYILLNENGLFACKNIIVNEVLIGVAKEKIVVELSKGLENIRNIKQFLISDGKLTYEIIDQVSTTQKIDTKIRQFKNLSNSRRVWAEIVTGENVALKKFIDNLFIQIQLDRNFIKGKIYKNFLSRFLEISSFSLFFLVLIILIIKKDRERNIQAEKLKENAIKANKAKSDFLAYTAHEIRSPLSFILTGTEMIKSGLFGPIPDKCYEYIEGINLNAKSILNFIIEILDEDRIVQNKFLLNMGYHDISKIIRDVIKHNKIKFYSKNVDILADFQEDLPALYCDEKKIYQAINNLVINSCKYSKEDISIYIKAFIDKRKLFIIIQDNGIGMDEKELELAMKKYEFTSLRKDPDSYGLGLSIVKLLLDAHEAEFYINSKKNLGTSVTIVFNQKLLEN